MEQAIVIALVVMEIAIPILLLWAVLRLRG